MSQKKYTTNFYLLFVCVCIKWKMIVTFSNFVFSVADLKKKNDELFGNLYLLVAYIYDKLKSDSSKLLL